MATPLQTLIEFRAEFIKLQSNLKNIKFTKGAFNLVKDSLIDYGKKELELQSKSAKQITTHVKERFSADSSQPTDLWIEQFTSAFVQLESFLSSCVIVNVRGTIEIRRPSKFISSSLEAEKFSTMINRVLRGLAKIIAYGDRIVLRSVYEEKKKELDRIKRAEKKKIIEKKDSPKKAEKILDFIAKYKTTFALLFLEVVIIVMSFLFNEINWVRILMYSLIPIFFILTAIGFYFEKQKD